MQPFTFFISYRRQDTAPIALLLKHEIEKRIQFVRVIVDVSELRLGDVFPERLRSLISDAHATIALIGKNWMPRRDVGPVITRTYDWVVNELEYSASAPIAHPERDRFGLSKRLMLPLFADCERGFEEFEIPKAIDFIVGMNAERIDYASWPVAIGPLIDRIAVGFGLQKRPDADEYPRPDSSKARTQPVRDEELASILSYDDYDGWYIDNFGNAEVRYLVKTFRFPHFNEAADFMQMVANHCRVLDHHPEWRNVFNHVTVSLTTWDARRRVTIFDLNLALFCNKAADAVVKTQ